MLSYRMQQSWLSGDRGAEVLLPSQAMEKGRKMEGRGAT